jgi:hypothetical protein
MVDKKERGPRNPRKAYRPDEKVGNRPSFEGDYLPREDGEKDPLKALKKVIALEALSLLRPISSISFPAIMTDIAEWQTIEKELRRTLQDLQDGEDNEEEEDGYTPVAIMSTGNRDENGEEEKVSISDFKEYVAFKEDLDAGSFIAIRATTEVFQGEGKRIGITYDQAETLAYLFGPIIEYSNDRSRFLAKVAITDVMGKVVAEEYIPISVENVSFASDGIVGITPDVEKLLQNQNFDPANPYREPHYSLEILNIISDSKNSKIGNDPEAPKPSDKE